jgi:hypothetical protein
MNRLAVMRPVEIGYPVESRYRSILELGTGWRVTSIPDVLESAEHVVGRAQSARVDEGAAKAWATGRGPADFPTPEHPAELAFDGDREASARVCLLLTSLNFCFWGERPWSVEYRGRTWTRTYAMFAGVLRAIKQDPAWLTARRWARADEAAVGDVFRGVGQIPLLAERRAVLNETGQVLEEQFGGRLQRAVDQADSDAPSLAYLLAEFFPSFRDVADYGGRPVAFLKRAQLCAADLHRMWQRGGGDGLQGLDRLTAFADYRLPQYLRHVGILELAPELAARIQRHEEIPAGSREEIELRAATIWATEIIRREMNGAVPAWRIDFVLWKRSHDPDVTIEHHRTRTVFY